MTSVAGTSAPRLALPRLTRRAFTELGLWMLVLGVCIGVVFSFALLPWAAS